MQNTDNFNLKLYEGEDLFNPLTVENVNVQSIDAQMKKNENHAVGDATELLSGTVHALTRLTPDTPMLRFTATSRFTAGDTFTVDGVQVSALTVSGEQLPDGAYVIGSEVLAYLKGTLLTFFTSQGTLATAQNALKLGGNTPEYYATATAVQQAQDTATSAGNLANEVNSNLTALIQSLKSRTMIGSNDAPISYESTVNVNLSQNISLYRDVIFTVKISGIMISASINANLLAGYITNNNDIRLPIVVNTNKFGTLAISGENSSMTSLNIKNLCGETISTLRIYGA